MMDIVQLFCDVDDFCQWFIPQWEQYQLTAGGKKRFRQGTLSLSEVMTIVILFHESQYRNFKAFYLREVWLYRRAEFPVLVSYNRFVELMARALGPLTVFLLTRQGPVTGISYIDSTPIAVCQNRRIFSHKVFSEVAQRGKNSVGWFYGFKVHVIINEQGDLLAFTVTAGNVDDRAPVPDLTKHLFGALFGDRGYISGKLVERLLKQNVQLVTKIKKKMKNRLMSVVDKILLRKRSIIETVIDQLKNISQIEHTRHRSLTNFLVNLLAGLIAYTYQEKKPSLNLAETDVQSLFQLAKDDALVVPGQAQAGPTLVF
jgi:hypothetical protein